MALTADILRLDPVVVVDEPNRFYRIVRQAAANVVAEAREKAKQTKK
ncbi:hypothetical protein SEA_COLUCCI_20 [Arthrobacter phage Colucci]|uniref:Uncharacterized protein n=1 Tax=Arthrobacter phage Colucci TaxID=2015834 RepID=A0A286N2T4_9CAUD|nr:hypothetical protein FDI27_gp020 [Arthrobacter phage Colucci]ASX98691.1 hypothetical protein SEA_COLUCCI_20 [Arthrobacter phage Colucci]